MESSGQRDVGDELRRAMQFQRAREAVEARDWAEVEQQRMAYQQRELEIWKLLHREARVMLDSVATLQPEELRRGHRSSHLKRDAPPVRGWRISLSIRRGLADLPQLAPPLPDSGHVLLQNGELRAPPTYNGKTENDYQNPFKWIDREIGFVWREWNMDGVWVDHFNNAFGPSVAWRPLEIRQPDIDAIHRRLEETKASVLLVLANFLNDRGVSPGSVG